MSDWPEIEDVEKSCGPSNGYCGWCGNCAQHAEDLREEEKWGDDYE